MKNYLKYLLAQGYTWLDSKNSCEIFLQTLINGEDSRIDDNNMILNNTVREIMIISAKKMKDKIWRDLFISIS